MTSEAVARPSGGVDGLTLSGNNSPAFDDCSSAIFFGAGPCVSACSDSLNRYQMLKLGSPVFEMASAIQARALALSAVRSAPEGALSLSPPAAMYSRAILPSDRHFSELSYFSFRSRTSATQRSAASLN